MKVTSQENTSPTNRSEGATDQKSDLPKQGPAVAVVFAGKNALDFLDLRLGAVRIPEVSLRIRQAQKIVDRLGIESLDVMGSIVTEDESFFRNAKIKGLLASIVQVGLYDRLLKSQRPPDVLVGSSSGDSALRVCSGQISFDDMILQSSVIEKSIEKKNREAEQTAPAVGEELQPAVIGLLPGYQAPLDSDHVWSTSGPQGSSGQDLASPSHLSESGVEFRAFVRSDESGVNEVGSAVSDLKKLMTEVIQHQNVTRFINVGPGLAVPSSDYEIMAEQAGSDEVTVIDSIDLDPMLNWFWRQMRPVIGYAQ